MLIINPEPPTYRSSRRGPSNAAAHSSLQSCASLGSPQTAWDQAAGTQGECKKALLHIMSRMIVGDKSRIRCGCRGLCNVVGTSRLDRSARGQGSSQVGLHPNDESELPAPLIEQRRPIGGGKLTKTTSDLHLGHKLPPSPASIAFSYKASSSSSRKARSPITLIKNQ